MSESLPRQDVHLEFHHWRLQFVAGPGNRLELFVNDCLRKARQGAADETLYVWTNLELEWEEHRWLEARLLPRAAGGALLSVTVNGAAWVQAVLTAGDEPRVTAFALP